MSTHDEEAKLWQIDRLETALTRELGDRSVARAWATLYFASIRDARPGNGVPALYDVVSVIAGDLAALADNAFLAGLKPDRDSEREPTLRGALRARLERLGRHATDTEIDQALFIAALGAGLNRLVTPSTFTGALGREDAARTVFDADGIVRREWASEVRRILRGTQYHRPFSVAFGRAVARILGDAEGAMPSTPVSSEVFPLDHVALTAGSLRTAFVPADQVAERVLDFALRARLLFPNLGITIVFPAHDQGDAAALEVLLGGRARVLVGDAVAESTLAVRQALPPGSRARLLWWCSNDTVSASGEAWLHWSAAYVRQVTSLRGEAVDLDELYHDVGAHARAVRDAAR